MAGTPQQQARMNNSAAWVGRKELERRARKCINATTCPLISVTVSTGAANTENSYVCLVFQQHPELFVGPFCQSYGVANRCQLIKKLYDWMKAGKTQAANILLGIRRIQTSPNLFERHVEYSTGYYAPIESDGEKLG